MYIYLTVLHHNMIRKTRRESRQPIRVDPVKLPIDVVFARKMDISNKVTIPSELRNAIGLKPRDFVRFKLTNTETGMEIEFVQQLGIIPTQIRVKEDVREVLDLYTGKSASMNKPLRVEIVSVQRPVYSDAEDSASEVLDSQDTP